MATSTRSPIPSPDDEVSADVEVSRRVAAAARRVAGALVTSRAPVDVLEHAAVALESIAARLEPTAGASRYDGTNGLSFAPGAEPTVFERHPFLGASNPLAPPMILEPIENGILGIVTLDARHEGVRGCAHGGWISALFDQVLGIAAAVVAGRPAMTGTLTIRFVRPTPIGTELRFAATARRSGDRTLHATATVTAADTITAEAEATLVLVRPDRLPHPKPTRR
jgi:acyl-coenzyme A thioesterase PaaI-like protein